MQTLPNGEKPLPIIFHFPREIEVSPVAERDPGRLNPLFRRVLRLVRLARLSLVNVLINFISDSAL